MIFNRRGSITPQIAFARALAHCFNAAQHAPTRIPVRIHGSTCEGAARANRPVKLFSCAGGGAKRSMRCGAIDAVQCQRMSAPQSFSTARLSPPPKRRLMRAGARGRQNRRGKRDGGGLARTIAHAPARAENDRKFWTPGAAVRAQARSKSTGRYFPGTPAPQAPRQCRIRPARRYH